MTYILTDDQEAAWNKDKSRREYLKSIKDTVYKYLSFKIDSLQATFDFANYTCCDSYYLTFGKNGKLKNIEISPYVKSKISDGLVLYVEDRIKIRRCKRQIKRIFKKINLSTFNLNHEVYRTFNFSLDNEWIITDNTIY
ncbi:MAG: hypothetical protein GY827_10650 [Cytophagales bacterium]|nr:hypothetical protein [Cytophagales bacterium]